MKGVLTTGIVTGAPDGCKCNLVHPSMWEILTTKWKYFKVRLDEVSDLCLLLCPIQWGWIADVWGRRPAMITGICGTIFSTLLFGTSQTFVWAVAARFLWGLLNGNLVVGKTYMSEVSVWLSLHA